MKVRELLNWLYWPLVGIAAAAVLATLGAYIWGGGEGLIAKVLARIDLRQELTLGTWYQSGLFAIVGLSFAVLAIDNRERLRRSAVIVFGLAALGCVFLSADEAASLHETLGALVEIGTGLWEGTYLYRSGFTWVLIYLPLAVVGLSLMGFGLRAVLDLLGQLSAARRRLLLLYGSACLAALVFFGLEVVEGKLAYHRGPHIQDTPLQVVEEAVELLFLLTVLAANLVAARALASTADDS